MKVSEAEAARQALICSIADASTFGGWPPVCNSASTRGEFVAPWAGRQSGCAAPRPVRRWQRRTQGSIAVFPQNRPWAKGRQAQ